MGGKTLRPGERSGRTTKGTFSALVALLLACGDGGDPTGPRSNAQEAAAACQPSCEIYRGVPDAQSVDAGDNGGHLLAHAAVRGPGAQNVWLRALELGHKRPGIKSSTQFRVVIDNDSSLVSLKDLTQGVFLPERNSSADSTVIDVFAVPALERPDSIALLIGSDAGAIRVNSWQASGRHRVVQSSASVTSPSGVCSFVAPTSTCENVTATVSPYFAGAFESGAFATVPCCVVSASGTIAFSAPVSSITITVLDPDFAGNVIVAHSAAGSTSYPVLGDNQPGTLTSETVSITDAGVTSLDLIPAPNDYVAYARMTFTVGGQIDVECLPAAPIRGSVLTCTAMLPAGEQGTLAVSSWTFTSSGPTPFNVNESASTTTWSGPIVASGHIDVTGTIDGAAASGGSSVTVQPRDWSRRQVLYEVQEITPANLPARPLAPADLGNHAGFVDAYAPPGGVVQVSGGPNAGVIFFSEVPIRGLSRIQINRVALSVGSEFYNRQRKNGGPPGSCLQADVMPFLPLAEDHEGLTLSPTSHAGTLKNQLNSNVPQLSEGAHAPGDLLAAQDMALALSANAIAAAKQASLDVINGGTVPAIQYCAF